MKNINEAVNTVSDYVNSFSCDYDGFAKRMGMEHRTLQQNFTKLCCAWLKYLSTTECYDDRNLASVKFAKSVKEQLGDIVLPLI